MMVSVREYLVFLVQGKLWVKHRDACMREEVIGTVGVETWIDIEDHRAWHVKEYGVQVAAVILLHHFRLGRGELEARVAAAYWRGKFAAHVLRACIDEYVHLTDVFINSWVVERVLDEVKTSCKLLPRMKALATWLN